jgi:hypothetical protein
MEFGRRAARATAYRVGIGPPRGKAERLLLLRVDDRDVPTRRNLAGKGKRMFYRIVLQGHAQQGVALDEVKRQFSYVTGLPPSVTEQLFGTAPTVIKRQVPAADAERISMTLRAIGATVTVEPVFHTPVPVGLDQVTVPGLPMAAAAIELPAPPPADPAADAPAKRRDPRRVKALLAVVVVAGALLAAYQYQETLRSDRASVAPTPAAKRVAEPADPSAEIPAFKAAHVVGPWRCTDQNTGTSTFWEYGEDGTVAYFGDDLGRSDKPLVRAGLATGWALEGNRLTLRHDAAPPRVVTLDALSLSALDYRDAKGDQIRCRRP